MKTLWLKIAIVAVVIVGVIVLAGKFTSWSRPQPQPEPQEKTVYDVWEQDEKRLLAEPKPKEPPPSTELAQPGSDQPPEPVLPEFEELSEIEKIDAEKLLNVAVQHRKMGRLGGIGLNTMVECCRQIIQKYPDSIYAFKAKRMLADIPERYRARYNITQDEIDLGDWK
jgi:type IV secretory pathway VirB10-like protein